MTHRPDISDLEDFLDGKLNPEEETRFKKRLAASPALREELSTAQQLKDLLKQLPSKMPPESYFQEVTDIIIARTSGSETSQPKHAEISYRASNRSGLTVFLQVAASLSLFFTALSLSQSNQDQIPVVMPVAEYQILTQTASSLSTRTEWELTEAEFSELEVGLTAVSSPGRVSGLYTMTNVYSLGTK